MTHPGLAILALATLLTFPAMAGPFAPLMETNGHLCLTGPAGPWLQLVPTVHGSYGEKLPASQRFARRFKSPTIETGKDGAWTLKARAQSPWATYDLILAARADAPVVRLWVRSTYQKTGYLAEEYLRFEAATPGICRPDPGAVVTGSIVDRAYRSRKLKVDELADSLGPRRVTFRLAGQEATLEGGRGAEVLHVMRIRKTRFRVELELDHRLNHPFHVHAECGDDPYGIVEQIDLSDSPILRGQTRELHARWVLGPYTPLSVARYPEGYRAGIVMVDHADRSSAKRLEALAFGRTGAVAKGEIGPEYPGLINRGLTYTKTIFLADGGPWYRPQWGDPEYEALLDRLKAAGVELGIHSPTGAPDKPPALRKLIDSFHDYFPAVTWVDHQPTTNCEAVSTNGWDPTSEWYVLQHLQEAGYRYVWAADHLDPFGSTLNLFRPNLAADRRPIVYRHGRLPSPEMWLFTSAPMFVPRREILDRFSENHLHHLSHTRGLMIAHLYLETSNESRFARRAFLEKLPKWRFRLMPKVDAAFRTLAKLQSSKHVWVTTLQALFDHLLVARDVALTYRQDGKVELRSAAAVHNLTLLLPPGAASALDLETGRELLSKDDAVWVNVAPGRPVVLQILDAHHQPISLIGPSRVAAPRVRTKKKPTAAVTSGGRSAASVD